jgi:hypothetical protein
LATLLVLIAYIDVIAQQNPHYTQYMYNMNVINPAYAGSKESISLVLCIKAVNIEDAYLIYFSGHAQQAITWV